MPAAAPRPADRPLCFKLGNQAACVDNDWKIVRNPSKGQCDWNDANHTPPYAPKKGAMGPLLFNLKNDPTESNPLNKKHPDRLRDLSRVLAQWRKSIDNSQVKESTCLPPKAVEEEEEEEE